MFDMWQTKKLLTVLTGLLLVSLFGVVSAQVDWGYGWNNGPTYPPTVTPTPTASPTPSPTPTDTVTINPTAQPTSQVNPIQSTNSTPKPTQAIPELSALAVIIALIMVSVLIVITLRRKPALTN
jgi:hypothetical protein